MSKVGFFTPISFDTKSKSAVQSLVETVDGYFYLGGKRAHIIQVNGNQTKAHLINENTSLVLTCLKVVSYFTVVLPVFMLTAKAILRFTHTYELIDKPIKPELAHKPIDISVIDTLGLDLEEQTTIDFSLFNPDFAQLITTKSFTLKQATEEVIIKINKTIKEKSDLNPKASPQENHYIILSTQGPWMKNGSNLFFYSQFCGLPSTSFCLNEEQSSKSWLNRIIQALVDKNHIQLIERNNRGYVIQV